MGGSDDQSDAMGRSDHDEEEIPMKQPADDVVQNNENDDDDADEANFLDDDFLSFSNVDNGGGGAASKNGNNNGTNGSTSTNGATNNDNGVNGKMSGRKRERSTSPMPPRNNNNNNYDPQRRPSIPWLNDSITCPPSPPKFTPPPQQQQQQQEWGRNRGYGNDNYNPPPPTHGFRTKPLIKLHNEIVSFVNLMQPTKEEMEVRARMVERVTEVAHRAFGGKDKCEVLPFGSQVTGLCLPGSDIDFVIRFPPKSTNDAKKTNNGTKKGNGKTAGEDKEGDDDEEDELASLGNPLHKFADAVRDEFGIKSELEAGDDDATKASDADDDDSEHLSYLEVIEQTRVPLVKFTVAPYDIDIDVCFDQPHGPESANLMHRFMESMPPLRPLTFVLKYFLASREINKPFTGGIGSYLLQLMIVSYLQHRAREDFYSGRDRGEGLNFNLGSLLFDFFEFYGMDFNYVTTAISVRHDGYYFAKGGSEQAKSVFWNPTKASALAIENPLDPTMDVGTGAFRIQMIHRIFQHAFKTLRAYVSEPLEPTDSILAMIIPPTEEMEHRMIMKNGMKEEDRDYDVEANVAVGGIPNVALSAGRNKKESKKPKKSGKKPREKTPEKKARHREKEDNRRGKRASRGRERSAERGREKSSERRQSGNSGGGGDGGGGRGGRSQSKSKKQRKEKRN